MNILIKIISEDIKSVKAIQEANEDKHFHFSGNNTFITEELTSSADIIIADRKSDNYNSVIDYVKQGCSCRLILLSDPGDKGLSGDIQLLKPSGIIFKPVDTYYVNTALKIAAAALSVEAETFSRESIIHVMEESPVMILLTGSKGEVIYTNSTFRDVTGYNSEEARSSLSGSGLILPAITDSLQMVVNSSCKWNGELSDRNKNGNEFTIHTDISPVKNISGNVTGYAFISEDITAKKKTENDLDKIRTMIRNTSEAKTRFISTLSHEIRTPMNAIIGMTDLALLSDDADDILDYLIDLKSAAGRLLDLTDNLLDFSKLETGEVKLEMEVFDLSLIIDQTVKKFTLSAEENNLDITVSISSELENFYSGDSPRICQILEQLISNSVKFTEKGFVRIEVFLSGETFIRDEKRYIIQFSVTDSGIGIPVEKQEIIFEKFRQCEDSRTRQWGGTGLGLAIAKSLAELMGGTIGVESYPGSGSRFFFYIPLKAETENNKPVCLKDAMNRKPERVFRILLVEDNPINSRIAEIVLKKLGSAVETAKNGIIALEKLKDNSFDLIFMDIEMPVMDGIETTQKIRAGAAGSKNKNIPIVAMTAYAVSEYEEECLKNGMNYFLTKPINITLIPGLLSRINTDNPRPSAG